MTREEALQRIVDNNFAGEYGFDLQILIDCMAVAKEIILNSQFPSEDCISRAEAQKRISIRLYESALNTVGYDCKTSDVFKDTAEKLSTCISEIPSIQPKPKTGWIPVSERLPEPFNFVNCTCHSLIDDREDWVVEAFYLPLPPDSPYSDWGNIPMLNWGECEVTAWMYRDIPKPYKAESEEV